MDNCQIGIKGQVTIVPCTAVASRRLTILIMGPSGAGKSTFIEALAGAGQTLDISSDQLSGFTQDVLCYELKNAVVEWSDGDTYPIYLIDTPGFCDSKISEMEIISKVKGWMNDQGIEGISNALYLSPITDTRVSGSKRRTIKMLQSLLQDGSASSVTVVTTMWNRVASANAKERAEAHFAQLRDDIWKDLVNNGTSVVRFQNDYTSAMDIVRHVIEASWVSFPLMGAPISQGDRSAPLLYKELLDRISNSRQEIENLRVDHLALIACPDPLLEFEIDSRLQAAKQMLAKFLGQLVQFGEPPQGFEGVPEPLVRQSLLDHVNEAKEDKQALEMALAQPDVESHAEREQTLRAQLQATEEQLAESLRILAEYVPNPRLLPSSIPLPLQVRVSETPEGSVASRASFGDRVQKRLKSAKGKVISSFRRRSNH